MNQHRLLLPLTHGLLPSPSPTFRICGCYRRAEIGRSIPGAISGERWERGGGRGQAAPLALLKICALALLGVSLAKGHGALWGHRCALGSRSTRAARRSSRGGPVLVLTMATTCVPSPSLGWGCPHEDGQCHLQPLGWHLGQCWPCLNGVLSWLRGSSQGGARGSAGGAAK